jgi:hypothetical protein
MQSLISKEEWKDIKGYEGFYKISNHGRVKSLQRVIIYPDGIHKKTIKEGIMNVCDNGNGYKCVYLAKNGIRKMKYIHRLVAECFIPNIENKRYINHKDFNKENNFFDNLEWCSQKENVNYSINNMKHENGNNKRKSKTGYKYIYYRPKENKYRVSLSMLNIWKNFQNIEDAIVFRDEKIKNNSHYFLNNIERNFKNGK